MRGRGDESETEGREESDTDKASTDVGHSLVYVARVCESLIQGERRDEKRLCETRMDQNRIKRGRSHS